MPIEYEGRELAEQAFRDNVSPRAARLLRLQSFVGGTQYDGMPSFWDGAQPLLKRGPNVVSKLVRNAVRSHASMVAGQGRFPAVRCRADDDASEMFGLTAEDGTKIDPLIASCVRSAGLRSVFRRMVAAALGCGTAVALVGLKRGRPSIDTIQAARCIPTFDEADATALRSLEILYPFVVEERTPTGRPSVVAKLYRRIVDERTDTVFVPQRANRGGAIPREWQVASQRVHGFGFVPAVWYRHDAEEATAGEIDGVALHQNLQDEIYALDLSRSQLNRSIVYTLDPMVIEIGVDPRHNPSQLVEGGGPAIGEPSDPARGIWGTPQMAPETGHRRGPGVRLTYPYEKSDVKYLTIPGDCFDAGFKNVAGLYEQICDCLHWRPIDPDTLKSTALSGRALEWLHRRQIDFDDELRADAGQHCLLPLVDMQLRIVRHEAAKSARSVFLPGLKAALSVLEKFNVEHEADDDTVGRTWVWVCPEIDLDWPPYFPPTEADEKSTGDKIRDDLAVGMITLKTAVTRNAEFYGIVDVDDYLEQLAEEKAQAATELHDANVLLAGNAPEESQNQDGEKPTHGEVIGEP